MLVLAISFSERDQLEENKLGLDIYTVFHYINSKRSIMLGIKVKTLLSYLANNSIIDLEDEISSITVEEMKQIVRFEGKAVSKDESTPNVIKFSATFDEIETPVSIKVGAAKEATIIPGDEDEAIRDTESKDEKPEVQEGNEGG